MRNVKRKRRRPSRSARNGKSENVKLVRSAKRRLLLNEQHAEKGSNRRKRSGNAS